MKLIKVNFSQLVKLRMISFHAEIKRGHVDRLCMKYIVVARILAAVMWYQSTKGQEPWNAISNIEDIPVINTQRSRWIRNVIKTATSYNLIQKCYTVSIGYGTHPTQSIHVHQNNISNFNKILKVLSSVYKWISVRKKPKSIVRKK